MAIHQSLAQGRWQEMSFAEQMGNIGSEVSRARSADARGDIERRNRSIDRALELVDLTVQNQTSRPRTRELELLRNVIAHARGTASAAHLESIERYCVPFALLARKQV